MTALYCKAIQTLLGISSESGFANFFPLKSVFEKFLFGDG